MITDSPFVFSWLVVFLLLGIGWYLLDRIVGIRVYRWLYDMTHEHPLAADVNRGFIHNRKAEVKAGAALVISILHSLLAIWGQHSNLLVELVTFFLQIPMVMIGFYLGPGVFRVWSRKEKFLDTLDKVESGEVKVGEELKEASQKAAEAIREALTGGATSPDDFPAQSITVDGSPAPDYAPPPSAAPSAVDKATPVEPPEDPRALMDRYLRRTEGRGDDDAGRD